VKRGYADLSFDHIDNASTPNQGKIPKPSSPELMDSRDDVPQPTAEQSAPPTASPSSAECVDEEAEKRRQDVLRESIRRMEEIARQEELDASIKRMAALEAEDRQRKAEEARKSREKQEQREKQEREQKARQEREQKIRRQQERRERREHKERERREEEERIAEAEAREHVARELRKRQKQDAARKLRGLKEATERELARCRERDRILQPSLRTAWGVRHAYERFKVVSLEFDTLKFSESQPFTYLNAPWPLLHQPDSLLVDDVQRSSVEAFFEAVEKIVPLVEYKELLRKTQQRFHPDKWQRLFLTMYDEQTREEVKKSGNVVCQAISPMWATARKL
jgi:hypothetical protein